MYPPRGTPVRAPDRGRFGLYGNESYPGIFEQFGGFADDIRVEGGFVRNPEAAGIGIERKAELYKLYLDLLG